ncbi:MAG: hypothetical protein BXU00_01295 [Candidatus Nanoclepta minutus]|uniref:Uncharacterized protein n=1 Tax=Candidatus Nanoclepta minutus TaxID=1940235 RepID=A0A397WQM6_9ARCH|nr:MAG: hypothetical protein BXU00_01295 [Candidatus Nanoclepta minutus]
MVSNTQDLYERCMEFSRSKKPPYPGYTKYIENECKWFAKNLSSLYKEHESTIKEIGEDHIKTLEKIAFPYAFAIQDIIETWEYLEKIGGKEAPKYLMLPYIKSLEDLYIAYKSRASEDIKMQSYSNLKRERVALDILLSNNHLIPEAIEIQKSRGPLQLSMVIKLLYKEGKISEDIMSEYELSLLSKYLDFKKRSISLVWLIFAFHKNP